MPFKLHTLDTPRTLPRKALARQHERLSRLQQQYESIDKRIFLVENGIERLENLSLAALKLHRSGLLEDLRRLQGRQERVAPLRSGMRQAVNG
ncbi:hypothetical protein D9M68_231820 [compost metagenome]